MKFKCSLNNNYEVIGLCNIEKYNKKIAKFLDKTWTQIILPEKLILPDNKPSVKNIIKVYLDIKITSDKIIETPSSDIPNTEGLSLTGKILLVSGEICQSVVYISETSNSSLHSVKFKNPFSTYIVIDENADIENDIFCIYPCVEDVSIRRLNERTLSKSLTLFLFAHKVTETPLPPTIQKLPNDFVFKTFDTDEEMVRIQFDTTNLKLMVKSTGETYNSGTSLAFQFELLEGDGVTVKISEDIFGNKNADEFANKLNDVAFEYGQIIKLNFENPSKAVLTDFRNSYNNYLTSYKIYQLYFQKFLLSLNGDYTMLSRSDQSFNITPTGIVPNTLLNTIVLNDINNSPVVTIQLDALTKQFLINSTGNVASTTGGADYFKMILLQNDGKTTKRAFSINGGDTAEDFKNAFMSIDFNDGDILKLEYEENNKVLITNYPKEGDPPYNPKGSEESFEITQNDLEEFIPPPTEKFLTNFVFKSENDEEMATIQFDKTNMELIVTSTRVFYGSNPDEDAFGFILASSSGTTKIEKTIRANQTAAEFKDALNFQKFEIGDSIGISYLDSSKVILNNYPDFGDIFNLNPASNYENFKITPTEISSDTINGTIIVKNKLDKKVLSISFSLDRGIFIVSSSGEVPDPVSSNPYFTLVLKDQNGTNKLKAVLNSNEDASNFKAKVNNKTFRNYSDNLTLIYKDNSKIEILDYPSSGDVYTPTKDYDTFIITQSRLQGLNFNNKIKILNENDEEMAKLYFVPAYNTPTVGIIATSTSATSTTLGDATKKYIQFLHYSENIPQFYEEILEKETASNFAMNLDGKIIDINERNILRLSNRENERIIITNYKNQSEYKIGEEPEFLEVSDSSLNPHSLNYNKIRLTNFPRGSILYIYFDRLPNGNIFIEPYATGTINHDADYFTFKITDPMETYVKLEGRINKNETGDVISINPPFNMSNDFNIGDLFIFTYYSNKLVQIFNPPFTNPPHNATGISEKFILSRDGFRKITSIKFENVFLFKTYDTEEDMARVEFDIANKKLIVTSLGNTCNAPSASGVFSFDLIDSSKQGVTGSFINGHGNANAFRNDLNGFNFDYDYIIRLVFSSKPKVVLTNYPNQGDIYNMISPDDQTFKITQTGIVPNVFKNTITVNDLNNNPIVTIQFDAYWKKLLVVSTGRDAPATATITYFSMTLYNSDGRTEIRSSRVTGGNNANSFKGVFNNEIFKTGYFLNITYKENRVSITNYPDEGTPIYTPTGTQKRFKFTKNGLE